MSEHETWEQAVQRKRRKKRIIILTVAVVFLLFIFGLSKGMPYVKSNEFCNNCHDMKPYYVSWTGSTHKNISCISCHFPKTKVKKIKQLPVTSKKYWNLNLGSRTINVSDFMNKLKKVVIYINKKYYSARLALNNFYQDSILVEKLFLMMTGGRSDSEQISWNSCETCHGNILSSSSKYDDVAHREHYEKGMKCSDCHGDLAHEGTKKITTQSCKSCHKKAFSWPASHNTPDYQQTHGQKYLKTKTCLICHTKGSKEKICMDCHGLEMPHQNGYPQYHVGDIKKVGIDKCMKCHEDVTSTTVTTSEYVQYSEAYLKSVAKTSATPKKGGIAPTCTKCHGKDMPHKGINHIIDTHGELALSRGTQTCFNCHNQQACSDCHGTVMPHPANFLRQHTREIQKIGLAKCLNCHDVTKKNMCSDCHQIRMPHPQNWKSNHGEWTNKHSQAKAVCTKCHSPKNPVNSKTPWAKTNFCQQCHSIKEHSANHFIIKIACNKCHDKNTCYKCHSEAELGTAYIMP